MLNLAVWAVHPFASHPSAQNALEPALSEAEGMGHPSDGMAQAEQRLGWASPHKISKVAAVRYIHYPEL